MWIKYLIFTTMLILVFVGVACTKTTQPTENSVIITNSPANMVAQSDAKPQEDKKPSEPQILWDFRKDDLSKPETFSKLETDAVFKYLFGETDPKLEIRSRISGAFTKPNVKETLYYLTGCKDEETGKFTAHCAHVDWDSDGWIAIYEGTNPVLKINEALGYSVDKVVDVNGDGKNEILSFSGYAQSGIQTQGMSLGEISDGKYSTIKSFSGWADNCGVGETLADDKKKAVALLVRYVPTKKEVPAFEEEYFETGCKNDEVDKTAWKKITKQLFEDFFKSVS